jgi:hypothetical protein
MLSSDEGTTRGVPLRFNSFISHLIEYIDIVKSPKEFLPMALRSKVMALVLHFRSSPR